MDFEYSQEYTMSTTMSQYTKLLLTIALLFKVQITGQVEVLAKFFFFI